MKREIERRLGKIESATGGPSYVVAFADEPIPSHAAKLIIVVPRRDTLTRVPCPALSAPGNSFLQALKAIVPR
jgi:hypothetical protein